MKSLLRVFYDILLKIKLENTSKGTIDKTILSIYLEPQHKEPKQLVDNLAIYFEKFYYFCFELENNSMIQGLIKFKH